VVLSSLIMAAEKSRRSSSSITWHVIAGAGA